MPHWATLDLEVRTIYCIGRNYSAHALEMHAVVPEDPIVFLKPPAAYTTSGSVIQLPTWSNDVHHEVELVIVIGGSATSIDEKDAWSIVAGVGIGLDLTARDVQARAKKNGEPWAVAKGWKNSAPVSDIVPYPQCGIGPWELTLSINNETRQHDSTSLMERTVAQLISYVAGVFSLRPGDAIFTGTPAGVSAVHAGDTAVATLSDIATLNIQFA